MRDAGKVLPGARADRSTWPTDLVTGHPPVCLACAWLSNQACPHLRKQYTAVRVRRFGLSGVHGVLYRPGYPGPVPHDVGGLDFGDDRMPWVQAAQLMMRLHDFRPVDLEAEYRACAEPQLTAEPGNCVASTNKPENKQKGRPGGRP